MESSGWLSDAQLEYAISFQSAPPEPLATAGEIARARPVSVERRLVRSNLDHARPLPRRGTASFRLNIGTRKTCCSPTCAPPTRDFGTIDYSEPTPLLFLGEAVEFDDLQLRNLRPFERDPAGGPRAPQVALSCPSCGAPLDYQRRGHTLSVVCPVAASPFWMPRIPNLQVLQKFGAKQRSSP